MEVSKKWLCLHLQTSDIVFPNIEYVVLQINYFIA